LPVDKFYEWQKTATGKQPYAIAAKGGGLMALAGLWENRRSPAGERVHSFAIVPKQGRLWRNDGPCIRLRPCWPHHVWAHDVSSAC
jgi:hypothetical protein